MIIYCLMCPRAKRGSSELKTLFCISCRQNCSNPISQAVNSVATSEPFCKPSSLQGSQSESCYQQPFLNAQCVPADRGSFGDLTQTHHLTNDGGLQQHNGHVSTLCTWRESIARTTTTISIYSKISTRPYRYPWRACLHSYYWHG